MATQRFNVFREQASWLAVLLLFCFSVASAQEDPFGGGADPFGGVEDPFGKDAPDPFGGGDPFGDPLTRDFKIPDEDADPFAEALRPDPRDVAREKEEFERQLAQRQRRRNQELVNRAVTHLGDLYLSSDADERLRLQAALSLIHHWQQKEPRSSERLVGIFTRLAQAEWSPLTLEETHGEMAARLITESAPPAYDVRAYCPVGPSVARWRERFEEHSDEPWPLDWRQEEAFHAELTRAFLKSLHDEDAAVVWQERIDADDENFELYAAAYLGVLRSRKVDRVATSIINRYVTATEDEVERLRRLAQSLASVSVARDDVNDFARKRLRDAVLKEVAANPDAVEGAIVSLGSIAEFGTDPEVKSIMEELIQYDSPMPFKIFCARGGIPTSTVTEWYMRKQVRLGKSLPAENLFQILIAQVELPVWVDSSVKEQTKVIAIETSGTWLDVLRITAQEADLTILPLDEGLLWIGPEAKRDEALQTLRTSRSKIPADDSKVAKALQSASIHEFIETPAEDVCDYFEDLHDVEIVTRWNFDVPSPAITSYMAGLPFHLALTLVCEENKLDWDAGEHVIAVGEAEYVRAFQASLLDIRTRRIGRLQQESPVYTALDEPTHLEFIETPLEDICFYLGDLHAVPVICVGKEIKEHPITNILRGVPLDWALSLMLLDSKLDWFADRDAIFIGTAEAVEQQRQLSARRTELREAHEMLLDGKLKTPVELEFIELSLFEVLTYFNRATGLSVELQKTLPLESASVTTQDKKLPADVHLDLMTSDLGLTWIVEGDGKIVIVKPQTKEDD